MERELGYAKEEDESTLDGMPELKIDMSDIRGMLESGACDNSMEAHSGVRMRSPLGSQQ